MHCDIEPKPRVARTDAVRRALAQVVDRATMEDLFFLENWEEQPVLSLGALLRVRQIQLAQPALAAEVRVEVNGRRRANPARVDGSAVRPAQPALSRWLRLTQ
jgi:hypothetical protein